MAVKRNAEAVILPRASSMSLPKSTGQYQWGRYTQSQIAIFAVQTVFLFFAFIAVGLRLWARRLRNHKLALNDHAAVVALVGCCGLAATVYQAVVAGMGRHTHDLRNPAAQIVAITKSVFALRILWAVSLLSVKISILDLYVKLFPIRPFRIAAYSVIVLSILCGLFAILEIFPLCQPFAYNWDKTIPGGHCVNGAKAFYAVVSTNLITDLLIVILPMPMTWRLQLPTTKKLALTSIFGIGLLICVISALRVASLSGGKTEDFPYYSGKVSIWSILEPTLGITNCCLPILQPALARLADLQPWKKTKSTPSHSGWTRNGEQISAGLVRTAKSAGDLESQQRQEFQRLRGSEEGSDVLPLNATQDSNERMEKPVTSQGAIEHHHVYRSKNSLQSVTIEVF